MLGSIQSRQTGPLFLGWYCMELTLLFEARGQEHRFPDFCKVCTYSFRPEQWLADVVHIRLTQVHLQPVQDVLDEYLYPGGIGASPVTRMRQNVFQCNPLSKSPFIAVS